MGFFSSLHRIAIATRFIQFRLGHIMSVLDQLTQDVAANQSAINSAVTLLNGLKQQLDSAIAALAAGDNGAALSKLSTDLENNTSALAAAVSANTPGGGAAAPAPADAPAAAPAAGDGTAADPNAAP